MFKIKVYADFNIDNPVLQEILSSNLKITNDIGDADIVAVFFQKNVVSFVERLLEKPGTFTILIEMIPHHFKSDRVFMINTKSRDLNITNFKNYLFDLDVIHIDFSFVHHDLNLKAEVMNCLTIVGDIIGWKEYENNLNLRFSYNDHSVHVSGYIRESNFTLSIFISNTSNYFVESIKVYTKNDGTFILDSDYHEHSYGERYGAALQKVLQEALQRNLYHQQKINSVIKSCIRRGSSSSGSGGPRIVKRFHDIGAVNMSRRFSMVNRQ